jgi:hypothetical protein
MRIRGQNTGFQKELKLMLGALIVNGWAVHGQSRKEKGRDDPNRVSFNQHHNKKKKKKKKKEMLVIKSYSSDPVQVTLSI